PAVAARRVAQAVAVVVVHHVDRALVVVDISAAGPARRAVMARSRLVMADHGAVDHPHRGAIAMVAAVVAAVVAVVPAVVAVVAAGLAVVAPVVAAVLAMVAAVLAELAPVMVAMAAAVVVGQGGRGHGRQRHGQDGAPGGELQVHASSPGPRRPQPDGVGRLSAAAPESILPEAFAGPVPSHPFNLGSAGVAASRTAIIARSRATLAGPRTPARVTAARNPEFVHVVAVHLHHEPRVQGGAAQAA